MTLKAFKSAIRVGMQISATDHWQKKLQYTLRTVTQVQGNGFYYLTEGDTTRSFMDFPKASELEFDGTTARIRLGDGTKHWTLDLAPNGIVDHHRWERTRAAENEIDGERRMAEEAQARGADMQRWRSQWLKRSDDWRDEIGHECEVSAVEGGAGPAFQP